MNKLKQIFFTGLFTLLPLIATIYILYVLFSLMDNFFRSLIQNMTGVSIPGIGVAISVLLILITGFIATNVLGSKLLSLGDKILQRIPIVKKVYTGLKQIINAVSMQGKQLFKQVVLIEFPQKGTYAIGFATGECKGEVEEKVGKELIYVYVPTSPNPTMGALLLFPKKDVVFLDMEVEEGLKLIISAGLVSAEDLQKEKPTV